MQKIVEKILEPSKIFTGSNFLLKIKAIRHATYNELLSKNFENIKNNFTYKNLKGD